MKKLLIIALTLFTLQSFGQYQSNRSFGYEYKRLKADSTLHIPTFCGTPTLRNSPIGNQAAIGYDSCGGIFYVYNPKDSLWSQVTGSGSGIDSITLGTDYYYLFLGGVLKDSVGLPTDTLKVSNDFRVENDTLKLKTDSIHKLTYRGDVDTSVMNDMDLPPWKYIQDHISASASGVGQGQLDDSTEAIRHDFPVIIKQVTKPFNGVFSNSEIDVFIVAGQSNASGRGVAADAPTVSADEGLKWVGSTGTFETYSEPFVGVNDYSQTGSAWGAFAKKYYELTGRTSAYILTSKGGTGVIEWISGATLQNAAIADVEDALAVARASYSIVNLAGVLWCQGERDGIEGTSEADYKTSLQSMIGSYRTALSEPELPLFIFELGANRDGDYEATYDTIRTAQNDFCSENRNAFMVFNDAKNFPSEGLQTDLDHYTQAGYNKMGTVGAENAAFPASVIIARNRIKFLTDNPSAIGTWSENGSKIYYNGGNVGIGTDTASSLLEIRNNGLGSTVTPTVILSNKTPAASGSVFQNSPFLAFVVQSWLTASSTSSESMWSLGGRSVSGTTSAVSYFSFLFNGVEQAYIRNDGVFVPKGISSTGANSFSGFTTMSGGAQFTSANGYLFGGFGSPANGAYVEINSTSKAFLPSRLTTAQRDAITGRIGVGGGTVTSGGTSYTNGTFTNQSLTGGHGTGATATIVVASGSVTTATISSVSGGSGYVIGDILSASLAGGSGFTYTVTSVTGTEGLIAFNTNKKTTDVYNGIGWNSNSQDTYKIVTTDSAVLITDRYISVNNGSTNVTITLPDATTTYKIPFVIKRYDATSTGTITVATSGGNVQSLSAMTFGSTTTIAAIGSYGQSQEFKSNGTNYEVR